MTNLSQPHTTINESIPVCEMREVYFSYPAKAKEDQWVLGPINFKLMAGKSMGIIGPNGGGKTTLIKLITGFLTPTKGEIFFDGKIARNEKFPTGGLVSYVPQHSSLNFLVPMPLKELLEMGELFSSHKNPPITDSLRNEILELVGLSDYLNAQFHELSGGQKQRALIARALCSRPRLLILDEPQSGLDSLAQDKIFHILTELKETYHTASIIVDHNLGMVISHSDEILCLNKTLHWHDQKELFSPSILESIYHCELEHLLIHQVPRPTTNLSHAECHSSHDECDMTNNHHEIKKENKLK
jgi:zinc transport system ATP-binding protein